MSRGLEAIDLMTRYSSKRFVNFLFPILQLYSDLYFGLFHDEVTAHHAAHFPGRHTFRYQFDYSGETSLSDMYGSEIGKHCEYW